MSDADYPELLIELATVIGEQLERAGIGADMAAQCGFTVAEYVRETWGGQFYYLPKGRSIGLSDRDMEIWRQFRGNNVVDLAKQYGLSKMRIYQILQRVRHIEMQRVQPDLFGAGPSTQVTHEE